jgi:ribosomal protein L37E
MAVCSRCGQELNSKERFCGNCGFDTMAGIEQTKPQQTVSQQTAPQAVYVPPAQAMAGRRGGGLAGAAMGLGIAGGLLGILWGSLGPYLTVKSPSHFQWATFGTGLKPEILLVIGLVLGALAVLGGIVAPKAVGVARVVLFVCGLGGFVVGAPWLIPGALLLTAFALSLAAKPQ